MRKQSKINYSQYDWYSFRNRNNTNYWNCYQNNFKGLKPNMIIPLNLLPSSVVSTDLQNVVSNEVTYDYYDNKGNLQQYTTKDGLSTVIVWGYNLTQPIAKIEGAKMSDIQQSLIDSIVTASIQMHLLQLIMMRLHFICTEYIQK